MQPASLWGDINLDGLPDVAVATKELPITIFYNQK
jgi:hypothetical protein